MRLLSVFFLPILLVLPSMSSVTAAEKRPLSLVDLSLLKSISSPQISPDGKWVAAVVSATDFETEKRQSDLMLISVADGSMKAIVKGTSPQWSPDGNALAYQGTKDEKSGIWIYDIKKESTRFLTTVHSTDHFLGHRARKNYAWSPDGQWMAYVGAEPKSEEEPKSDVKVFTRILYKTRTAFSDNRRTHLWIVPIIGGEPKVITPGKNDEHSLTWSPDSGHLAFISNRSEDPDDNHLNDLWRVDVTTGQVTRLTDTVGAEFQPAWSPDGRQIAYLANVRPVNTKDSPPENTKLYVLPASGGKGKELTRSLDRRVSGIGWHPDAKHLYFSAGTEGMTPIYRVATATGEITPLVKGLFAASSYSLDAKGETMAFTQTDMSHPRELMIARSDGGNVRRLTTLNEAWTEQVALQDAESIWFENYDKTRVQGWLMKPADFEEGKKYPLILYVHGGPHGMYGYRYSDRFQMLAGHGYGILFINPRGSRGYGQTFADGCVLNWGGGDYQDLMAGVDHVLANHTWTDEDRLGVIGGSYGGFMTNWIITQTDRFKAAIPVASVSNLVSFYGTSLYQLLIETEFNGKPWNNYGMLWQWSPLNHIKNATTPTLLIHGENDHDVPITQAEEMYIGLKKRGVEAMFVRYPGEGHGIRQPGHVRDYRERILEWFDQHVKTQGNL